MKSCDVLVTVSSHTREELQTLGVPRQKINVLGTGVDEAYFRPGRNGQRDTNSVLAVGRLAYRKGLPDLIQASKGIITQCQSAIFNIVGSGPLRGKLEKSAKRLGVSDSIRFMGHVPAEDLQRLYQTCSVFVLPSHYEGLPAVLLEAMACGAPTVATAIGGTRDLLVDGVNGLVVPPSSPNELAGAIISVLRDKEYASKLGGNGQATVLSKYTWSEVALSHERLYEKLLAG